MIGTRIRGFRHFIRMAKTLQEITFLYKYDVFSIGKGIAMYVDGGKYKNPFTLYDGDYLLVFNDCLDNRHHGDISSLKGTDIYNKVEELFNKHPHIWVVPVKKGNFREDSSYIRDIVLMPSNFDELYKDFCNANKKQMPNATKYANINCAFFNYIFAISSGSKNFFFWAINAYFKAHTSIYLIENILRWNDKYNQLQSKLKKGTITAYTSSSDIFNLIREMTNLRRDKRANDVINSFNTSQKKLLKGVSLTDRDYETLSKFGKLSAKKKSNFIRKMSTIEDPAEILRQMSFLADIHFEWNKESFLDYYKNMDNFNCELVMERGNMVLLKVKDYEAIKRLAKSTNWCISKDKKYWNEYVGINGDSTQYVLFDFSKKEDDNLSIVGFTTVHDRGITHAHDFQNRNIMGSKLSKNMLNIKSFVNKHIDCNNIYGVLDKYGVSLSDIVSYEPFLYEWNRDSMFNFLEKCVSFDDYYVIADDGDKVALIIESNKARYFFGDTFMDNFSCSLNAGECYIVFADFTKNSNNPDKLIFGVVRHNISTHESSCERLYNSRCEQITTSFDSKLSEYGLPYDIICRTDNPVDRFYSAYSAFEANTAKELIKDEKVKNSINNGERRANLRDGLFMATFNYFSSDYMNLIYDNGFTIGSFIGTPSASDYGRRLINTMIENNQSLNVPTEKDIEDFYAERIDNYSYAIYVGLFIMAMSFIDHENCPDVFGGMIATGFEIRRRTDLFDLIITRYCNKFGMENNVSISKIIVNYAFNNNSNSVLNVIMSKKPGGKVGAFINSFIENGYKVKTTEIWVKESENRYVLQKVGAAQT